MNRQDLEYIHLFQKWTPTKAQCEDHVSEHSLEERGTGTDTNERH